MFEPFKRYARAVLSLDANDTFSPPTISFQNRSRCSTPRERPSNHINSDDGARRA